MKKQFEIKTCVTQYDSLNELSAEEQQLMQKAVETADKAYAPYSHFYVGAALLLENGKIITGNNQENIAYPSGLCAERVAIFNAGSLYPEVPVKTIAITAKSTRFKVDKPVSPCGACRQSMSEYEHRHNNKIKVLLMGESGGVYEIGSIQDLLPLVFNESGLKE